MTFNRQQFHAFITIASVCRLGRAAETLHVTQPSYVVATLDHSLRGKQGITLTDTMDQQHARFRLAVPRHSSTCGRYSSQTASACRTI